MAAVPDQDQIVGFGGDRRFELLVNAVTDYAIYLLDVNGHVASWNSGAQRFKGYSAEEIIGQHFSAFYTAEDRATGLPARALRTAETEGKFEQEGWRVRKDGTRFPASVLIDPIRDETGRLIGFAKVTRDLTERWKAQQDMQATREALAQAQKMEAIGRLTGGVAHDFNNLLTVIRASADLLGRSDLAEEKRQRYVRAIAETAERAAQLTGQLLAFARRQPLKPERFDVAARLGGMGQIINTTLGSPVQVAYLVESDVGVVEADPNQFETAILNMAINARDAMPAGGVLRISARKVDRVPAVRGHAAVLGSFVAVTVEDDGTGIAPDTLARIFEPFFTTKEVNKGTGLGLSQVYGFAKQSGGEISVESEPGEGSRFTLFLPRIDHAEPGVAVPVAAPAATSSKRRSVLLVEDNETVGSFAHSLLEELGQDVTWVIGAEDALRILEERHAAFDLVFSDVVMPGMNGIDLAQEVRDRWPDLPVVLTSGYSHILAEEGSHGFDLLKKPYSIEGLLEVLRGGTIKPE
ncbi:MAG TPA: ATP-binding protein [Sphingomonas sp.]|uniref:PAS domain-containing sensor histidine kinase n=1 Tax=Sphingomonas sp. TaxID=28214 RepID=UPI002C13EDC3|nr:ATP-binding protein [Sphingomonas sp.]HMI21200.1 ATP-binding protein [Sphingomonas sp.]